VQIGTEPV